MPFGCSLESLRIGASALGFPTDIRFLRPKELSTLKGPYILHTDGSLEKGVGHFLIVVSFDPKNRNYTIIDTAYETSGAIPETSILRVFSGYALVPRHDADVGWRLTTAVVFIVSGFLFLFLWHRRVRNRSIL